MTVFEMAKKYYPRLWNKNRIDALHDAGRLTADEYSEIMDMLNHKTEAAEG